jgi:hypothetical protein
VLILFVVLGIIYSLATPVFEASDEWWHYPVVKHIADGKGLPVQNPAVPTYWHQEGSQPPLYYLLAAGLTSWIDTSDLAEVRQPNPHAVVGLPLVVGNKNMVVNADREHWPWRGTTLAVYLIRLWSVMLGAITVWLTWHVARCLWHGADQVALLAAMLTAFNPMFLFISASVNNDSLAALLAAAVVLVLLRALYRGQSGWDGLWLGVLLGLGALTKLSVLVLALLVAVALSWDAWRRRVWRTWLFNGVLIIACMSLIAGWWYWRNWTLYGDPTGLNRMLDIAGRRDDPMTLHGLWAEFQGFRISYWGLFGGVNILMDRWIYSALDALMLTGGLGVVVSGALTSKLVNQRITKSNHRSLLPTSLFLLVVWVGLAFASLIRWTWQTHASQGRLMFVAIAGISTLLATGLGTLTPARWRSVMVGVVGGGLLLLAAISPFRYIMPAYARSPLLSQEELPADLHRLDWVFENKMKLLGYRLGRSAVHAAENLPVEVYWQALEPMSVNYSTFVHLHGRERAVIGALDTYPGLGLWPTTALSPGDIVADTYSVPVEARAEEHAPARLRVAVGLYRYDQPGRPVLPGVDAAGQSLSDVFVGEVKLVPWQWPTPQPARPLSVRFGDGIILTGADSTCTPQPVPCDLTFYWTVTRSPSADYQVFIQLWRDMQQVAGFDGPPVGGDYPSSWWADGEVIVDQHTITMPADLPPGDYRWRVGLYRLDTGARLGVLDDGGATVIDQALMIPLGD